MSRFDPFITGVYSLAPHTPLRALVNTGGGDRCQSRVDESVDNTLHELCVGGGGVSTDPGVSL